MNCLCSEWDEIGGFQAPSEYDRFVKWIEEQVKGGTVREIKVEQRYGGFRERWFRCGGCEKIWRLVDHDFPFKGLFAVVKGNPDF
jgi:hypothetical protein